VTIPPDTECYEVVSVNGGSRGSFLTEESAADAAQEAISAGVGVTLCVVRKTSVVTQVISPQVTVVTQTAAEARDNQ